MVFLGGVAKIYPNLTSDAKKYQQAFLVPLPGIDSISILGDCAKKCQQFNRLKSGGGVVPFGVIPLTANDLLLKA